MKNYNSSKEIIIFIPSIESGGVEKNFFILLKFLFLEEHGLLKTMK